MVIDLDETLVHSSFKVSKLQSGLLQLGSARQCGRNCRDTCTGPTGSPRTPLVVVLVAPGIIQPNGVVRE